MLDGRKFEILHLDDQMLGNVGSAALERSLGRPWPLEDEKEQREKVDA